MKSSNVINSLIEDGESVEPAQPASIGVEVVKITSRNDPRVREWFARIARPFPFVNASNPVYVVVEDGKPVLHTDTQNVYFIADGGLKAASYKDAKKYIRELKSAGALLPESEALAQITSGETVSNIAILSILAASTETKQKALVHLRRLFANVSNQVALL